MNPEEALRRAENLCAKPYMVCTMGEARAVMTGLLELVEKMTLANAGLLQLLDARQVDAQMRDILKGEEK